MSTPAYIAFQGGGARGMAHLGAWQKLAERFTFAGVAGTSAGAIVAGLCAAGYDSIHATETFHSLNWSEYIGPQRLFGMLRKLDAWSDGEHFYSWIQERMGARFPDIAPQQVSFAELYRRTNTYLAIVACDLNRQQPLPVIFDKDTEPETLVAFAVRASISIPGYFSTVPRRDRGQEMVDGGVLLNLPASLLQSKAQGIGCPLIGVRFSEPWDYLENPKIWETLGRTKDVLLAAGSLPGEDLTGDPNYIDVIIDVTGFSALDFNLSSERKQELVRRGKDAATRALLMSAQKEPAATELINAQSNQDALKQKLITRTRKLTPPEINELVNRLMACPCMIDPASRTLAMHSLPKNVQNAIPRHAALRVDVANIVRTCLNYPNALEVLIEAVRSYDEGMVSTEQLDQFLQGLYSGGQRS